MMMSGMMGQPAMAAFPPTMGNPMMSMANNQRKTYLQAFTYDHFNKLKQLNEP